MTVILRAFTLSFCAVTLVAAAFFSPPAGALTPEQMQMAKELFQRGAKKAKETLTPEQMQAAKELLQVGAQKAKEKIERVRTAARAEVAAALGRQADCREAAAALENRQAEFLLAAYLSRDIHERAEGRIKRQPGEAARSEIVAESRRVSLWFDAASDGYAEVHHDALPGAEIIVFRGTRVDKLKDLSTNLVQFVNIVPERYRWAASLVGQVARETPGARILVTGHSLGGALATYAALAHDAEAVVFNPAGLSRGALATLSPAALEAGERNIVAFITCGGEALDPVSALSLAGDTVMVGRRYLVEREPGLDLVRLHKMDGFARELAARVGVGSLTRCENDLGSQGFLQQ